jgi:hypothetical protein
VIRTLKYEAEDTKRGMTMDELQHVLTDIGAAGGTSDTTVLRVDVAAFSRKIKRVEAEVFG